VTPADHAAEVIARIDLIIRLHGKNPARVLHDQVEDVIREAIERAVRAARREYETSQ
jgi:hypothetical protein